MTETMKNKNIGIRQEYQNKNKNTRTRTRIANIIAYLQVSAKEPMDIV